MSALLATPTVTRFDVVNERVFELIDALLAPCEDPFVEKVRHGTARMVAEVWNSDRSLQEVEAVLEILEPLRGVRR